MQRQRITTTFYAPIIKAAVALVLLGFLRVVLLRLPMMRGLTIPQVPLPASEIVRIVISLLMIAVVLNFGREFGHQLRLQVPGLSQGGTILTSVVYVVAVVLAYDAFNMTARLFLEADLFHVYQWVFVLLAIPGILMAAVAIYGSIDDITALFTREIGKVSGELIPCPNPECKELNPAEAQFCFKCGSRIEVAPPATLLKCSKCGADNPPQAIFCAQCGTKLEAVRGES